MQGTIFTNRYCKCKDQCFNNGLMYFGGKYAYNIFKYWLWIFSHLTEFPQICTWDQGCCSCMNMYHTLFGAPILHWNFYFSIFSTPFLLNVSHNMKHWRRKNAIFWAVLWMLLANQLCFHSKQYLTEQLIGYPCKGGRWSPGGWI